MDIIEFTENKTKRSAMIRELSVEKLNNDLIKTLMDIIIKEFDGYICLFDVDTGTNYKESVWDPMHEMFIKNPYEVIAAANWIIDTNFPDSYGDNENMSGAPIIEYLIESREEHSFTLAEFKDTHTSAFYIDNDINYTKIEQIKEKIHKCQCILSQIEEFLKIHPEITNCNQVSSVVDDLNISLKYHQNYLQNFDEITKIITEINETRGSYMIMKGYGCSIRGPMSVASKIIDDKKFAEAFYAISNDNESSAIHNPEASWNRFIIKLNGMFHDVSDRKFNETVVSVYGLVKKLAELIKC